MNLAKISKRLRIKWNFELTVFELTVPDLYVSSYYTQMDFFTPSEKYRKCLSKLIKVSSYCVYGLADFEDLLPI